MVFPLLVHVILESKLAYAIFKSTLSKIECKGNFES